MCFWWLYPRLSPSRSNDSSYGYQPRFIPSYHFTFGKKGWLKNDIKNCCWRLNGGRRIFKSVFIFSPMLDTNFINVGQKAHKL